VEVIVVNDGSSDSTLARLQKTYELRRSRVLYVPEIPTAAIRGIYHSSSEARLLVVDKQAGGSKADAVNAGLNAATSPYVCVVDSDSVLERDSLLRMMAGVFTDPSQVVALGGIVRLSNGCVIEGGELKQVRLPTRFLEVVQVIEYLRAFLVSREAWAQYNVLPIISGAFGIFRRDLVKRVGGYRAASIGEDFDLVIRLHRYMQESGADYDISFIPDPTCWTEAPWDFRSLARQRARWQKGLLDTLWRNRDMLFRITYGRVGWVILPYMWIFELLAPLVELTGYCTIFAAAALGMLGQQFVLLFLIFGYAFATLISVGSVLLEEMTYRRYARSREVARLLIFCLLEHFPYRQLTMIWRLQGMWQYLRGDLKWRELKRSGWAAAAQ
jgi:cellulose synthase/poly-beta-1,6-N-acetylglucosamine synthase-like glycosyltransferase